MPKNHFKNFGLMLLLLGLLVSPLLGFGMGKVEEQNVLSATDESTESTESSWEQIDYYQY